MTIAYMRLTGSSSGAFTPWTGWSKLGTMNWAAWPGGQVGGGDGCVLYDTYIPGTKTIHSQCQLHGAIVGSWGLVFYTSVGTGIQMYIQDNAVSVRKITTRTTNGTIIATASMTNNTNAVWSFQYDDTTGNFVVYKNYVSVLTGNYDLYLTNTNLLGGINIYTNGNPPSFTYVYITNQATQISGLDFSVLPNTDPYNPPTDWKAFQNAAKIESGAWRSTLGTTANTSWVYDVNVDGLTIVETTCGPITSTDSAGPAIINTNGDGFWLLVRSGDIRVFSATGGVLGSQLGITTGTVAENDRITAVASSTDSAIIVYKNDAFFALFTGLTFPTGIRNGLMSRSSLGTIKQIKINRLISLVSITSINGGANIRVGQTGIQLISAGFTSLPTSVTANVAGVSCSGIGGTVNSPTFNINDRTNSAAYPKDLTAITYTVSNSSESATIVNTISRKANEVKVVAASPVINDTAYLFGAILSQYGRTVVNNDEVYYIVPGGMSDLSIAPNGQITSTNDGTFTVWLYVTATGMNYVYDITYNRLVTSLTVNLIAMFTQSESPKFDSAYYAADRP